MVARSFSIGSEGLKGMLSNGRAQKFESSPGEGVAVAGESHLAIPRQGAESPEVSVSHDVGFDITPNNM